MSPNRLQERDACLALVFLILLLWLFLREQWVVYAAMAALLLGMIWPSSMRPFAIIWYGIANILGRFMSKVLLSIVWLVLVAPVGIARKMAGKDSLRLNQWRGSDGSVFVARDHKYVSDDLKNPY